MKAKRLILLTISVIAFLGINLKASAQDTSPLSPDSLGKTIPVVILKGDFGYDYANGTVTVFGPQLPKTTYEAKIKWRGGTTNAADKHKRNYKIKLSTDQQLFGMRKDNTWILDAGQQDIFRLRNRVATELWNDFARKPYYASSEPSARTGVRGQVVEVFLNDEYRGVYCLTEAMDRKELKLKKTKGATIHGQLWKSTGYGASMMYRDPPAYDNTSETWDVFETKYPELEDVNPTEYADLWKVIHFVATSNNQDFRDSVAYYFDMPVVEDYYIFTQTLCAPDNTAKNMYMAIYDRTVSPMLTFAVWDLNLTVGSIYLKNYSASFVSPEYRLGGNNLIERLKATDAGGFNHKVQTRYQEARKGILSTDSLIARFARYRSLLKQSGADDREREKWSGDSDICGEEIDFDNEMSYIEDWITRRMKYLDSNVFNISTGIDDLSTIETLPDDAYYTLQGLKVGHDQLRKGIYIQNHKKILIRN